jgi:hypothetical protein
VPALRWFDVNSERNVPTAWSTLLLLAGAAAAAALAHEGRRSSRPGTGWLLVASTAALLALEEWLELHERLGGAGEAVARDALHFAWVCLAPCWPPRSGSSCSPGSAGSRSPSAGGSSRRGPST